MELYLDSANLAEIKEAFKLGFLAGLTTTPTFMHRDGVTDVDSLILELASIVPVLQVEALGDSAEEIMAEAERMLALGLDKEKTVFKIPISLEGARACKMMVDKGFKVNLHLIYTVQQAYIALSAGATYVCPLVGRLQDQGHDALSVMQQCVDAVEKFNYPSKIMFSSVRHPEHVRNAINIGVHTCTIPWKVMKQLPKNHFTDIGTQQFVEHTRLVTRKVGDVIRSEKSMIQVGHTIKDALLEMTVSKLGAVTIVNGEGNILGVFTDGDLRRMLKDHGENVLSQPLSSLPMNPPITIEKDAPLYEASEIFKDKKIDTLVVTEEGKVAGMMDIHDLFGK